MLKQLNIRNFTVFKQANFEFASGLNVIVGENGTGKSHVLKLAYAVIAESESQGRPKEPRKITKKLLGNIYADKLLNVFRANKLEQFVRRNSWYESQKHNVNEWVTNQHLHISFLFTDSVLDFAFNYQMMFAAPLQPTEFNFSHLPQNWIKDKAVFMPTRELMTIYPGFPSLYENRYLQFEEIYYDTCLLLGEPLLKKPMTDLLSILEEVMGGKVELDRDRFYLVTPEQGKIEMPMVAEGIRKLAMLAQLIAVGALQKHGYLFWDEPEANLNPRLIKVVARVILQLAKAGIQVFIATHSLFLLRELEVLQAVEKKPVPQRYFALKQTADGVEVEQGNAIDDLQTLVLLDEELQQSDRYMALEQ